MREKLGGVGWGVSGQIYKALEEGCLVWRRKSANRVMMNSVSVVVVYGVAE